jgi:hypothetical protein
MYSTESESRAVSQFWSRPWIISSYWSSQKTAAAFASRFTGNARVPLKSLCLYCVHCQQIQQARISHFMYTDTECIKLYLLAMKHISYWCEHGCKLYVEYIEELINNLHIMAWPFWSRIILLYLNAIED